MRLLKKWKRKRELRYIPLDLIYESLYRSLKVFNEDITSSIKIAKKEYPKKEDIVYRSHYGELYDATYKIVLFGDRGVERLKLTQKFLTNLFKSDSKMTIGVAFEVKSLDVDNRRIKLQIWDFDSEERFRFLLSAYVRGANGALFIYDVTNYSSLAHIDDWLILIKKEVREEDIFPILVVGIVSESDEERQVPAEEGSKIAKSRGVDGFIECSARSGENVEETFIILTKLMLASSEPM
ncbi:MAG: Rab family GTPase [Promethearchaeota archaeon]